MHVKIKDHETVILQKKIIYLRPVSHHKKLRLLMEIDRQFTGKLKILYFAKQST